MASNFTWLDYSEHERQKALEVIGLFREEETRDELGLGTVRDAFADHFFPGTNTIQTRARYFLFIPWVYLEIEKRHYPSHEAANRSRKLQDRLRQALCNGKEERGVIGFRAGIDVQRLPSNIYWQGLRSWNIFRYPGTDYDYIHQLDRFYLRQKISLPTEKQETPDRPASNWDLRLPKPPENWLDETSFRLGKNEAEYLIDRIRFSNSKSMLAFLLGEGKSIPERAGFPWVQPGIEGMPEVLKFTLKHARSFSEVMHGAALLYNLILSEQIGADDWVSSYLKKNEDWWRRIHEDPNILESWKLNEFRGLLGDPILARINDSTWLFIEQWVIFVRNSRDVSMIRTSKSIRNLIENRERLLKRGRMRIGSSRAKEDWNGASGTGQLDYRWNRPVRDLVNDILQPLKQEDVHA
jgi:hypothetical protein